MPKRLPASIVIDLNPIAAVGPVALLQGQGNIAKFSPATRVEQLRFGGCNCSLDRRGLRVYCGGGGSSHDRFLRASRYCRWKIVRGQALACGPFGEYAISARGI
jgi:hypothetical protein